MPRLTYTKKKGKQEQIASLKDETAPKEGLYKSHKISVPSGESPSSRSKPTPKKKAGIAKPITSGKLLKAGGPSVRNLLYLTLDI
jgi:myosin I